MRSQFALVVIDMLVDYFDGLPVLASRRQSLVAGVNELTSIFRDSGQSVIWVRQEFKRDLSDAFLDMRRRGVRVTIEGTGGSELLPELEQGSTDHVIVKKRYSAFFGTEFAALLGPPELTTLVVAGINTHACVRTTVIDAYQRDFEVILAEDCIASYDQEHHDISIRYMTGRMARLLRNTEISRLLPSRTAGIRP